MHSWLQLKAPYLHIMTPTAAFRRMVSTCAKDLFISTTGDSNTRQAGTPLLDFQPVCHRTRSCSEEDPPRVGLDILRALAERLPVVRRLRVPPPLSVL